jgi:hypothetical protein
MGQVWKLDLPVPEKFVLLALADHAHDDGTRCFPGVAYLAWKTGYSERQVQRMLRHLERRSVIVPVANRGGGRGMATEYAVTLEKGVKSALFAAERVTSLAKKGDVYAKKGDTDVTPTINIRHEEPSTTPTSPDEFAEFWQTYPRKEGKKKARVAWRKVRASERHTVLTGLELWKRSGQWNRDGGQYIPHASTFLNQERWKECPHDLTRGETNEEVSTARTNRRHALPDRFVGVGRKAAQTMD